jgi:UTP--glucose-1-phosphate uridylyltransferase
MSEELVAGEDFAVLLADDLIFNDRPCTQQLIDCYLQNAGSVIGVMEVPKSETQKYGIVDGEFIEDQSPDNNKTLKMKKMIEKPKPELAPTNLATPGRYILKNSIFQHLKTIKRGAGGEYQLTDAINQMCQSEENVFAFIFAGKRYDTGSLKGYIEATIDMALSLDETSEFTYQILKNRIENR